MILNCENAELRGVLKRTKSDNSSVYLANFEDETGDPFQLYLGGDCHILTGYKKGDKLTLTLDYFTSSKGSFLKLVGVGNCE